MIKIQSNNKSKKKKKKKIQNNVINDINTENNFE